MRPNDDYEINKIIDCINKIFDASTYESPNCKKNIFKVVNKTIFSILKLYFKSDGYGQIKNIYYKKLQK